MQTGPETQEFRAEFAAETDRLLRRRLRWFISIWGGLGLLGIVALWFLRLHPVTRGNYVADTPELPAALRLTVLGLGEACWLALYASGFFLIRGRAASGRVIRLSLLLIFADGLLGVLTDRLTPDNALFGLWTVGLSHLIASLVFPWTPWQAAQPMIGVLLAAVAARFTRDNPTVLSVFGIFVGVTILATPGTLIAWFKHSRRTERFAYRFLQSRYGTLRQELVSARRIHEALFPRPITDGPVGLTYAYEPMRQIGGDFLFSTLARPGAAGLHAEARRSHGPAGETYSVVLLDVTGHGIPAALTVNRLHGEIELMFAANPDASPAEVIAHLNRYVHLTLARHSIFVTGIALRIIPDRDEVEYVNAGHPPAFLRAADGTVHELPSTTFLLGACPEDRFDPAQESHRFCPGDSLIAYTDGASEAKTLDGQMLRIQGMRRLVARRDTPRQGSWPETILRDVAGHRGHRPPEDDTLLVEVFRPIRPPEGVPPRAAPDTRTAPLIASAETAG